jgi:hypothetical protein
MPTVRITDAPLTIEDLLAVPTARRWNWVRGTYQDRRRPSRGGPGPGCRERRQRPHGPGRPRQAHPAGTGSLGLAEPCLIYGGIVYHLLLYEVVDQFADRRTPYRDAHLKLARAAAANGELHLGGAFADRSTAQPRSSRPPTSRLPSDSQRTIPMPRQDS